MSRNRLYADFTEQIERSPSYRRWVLLVLYKRQTLDERTTGQSLHYNGVGFTGPDANILSLLAEKVRRAETLGRLDEMVLNRRLPKYWGQFLVLARPPEMNQEHMPFTRADTGYEEAHDN